MFEVRVALWLVSLLITIHCVFALVGLRGLAAVAPALTRWWHFPGQLLSLAVFAAVVLVNPFR